MDEIPGRVREFAEWYTAAWCSQDSDRVAASFAEGGSLAINGGSAAIGREAISGAAREFMIAFPDLQVAMDRLVPVANRFEYHWTLTGTNTGAGGTGNAVRISGFES